LICFSACVRYFVFVKVKEKKQRAEVPFDPVLFAAAVPVRRPTTKDIQDTKAHEDDLIEPKEYTDTDELLDNP
jgi:hypothetical protein